MRLAFLTPRMHRSTFVALLLAVVGRALVPVGYMPSAERPFTLRICPDGLPAYVLAHRSGHQSGLQHVHGHMGASAHHGASSHPHTNQHTSGSHEHDFVHPEHCLVGAVAFSAPTAHASLHIPAAAPSGTPPARAAIRVPESLRFRVKQPRAPPALS